MAKRKRAAKAKRKRLGVPLLRAKEVVEQLQAHFETVHGATGANDCPRAELWWNPYGLEIYINDFRVWSTAVQGQDGCVDELDAAYCLVCFRQYALRLGRFGKGVKLNPPKRTRKRRACSCEVDRTP